MSFKDLLIQAKDGSHYAQEKIFLLYRPLLFKEACVYEVFDEDRIFFFVSDMNY